MPWPQRFFDPIPTPKGELKTLRDAGEYIASLPAREQKLSHWQDAAEAVLLVGNHGGDPMLARIGVMKALNFGVDQKPAPRVKRAKAYRIIP